MKNNYVVFVSENEKDYINSINYTFKEENVMSISTNITINELEELARTINESKIKKVVFFDYEYKFYMLLPMFSKDIEVSWIFKPSISEFASEDIYNYFKQILEYSERHLITKIYALNKDVYEVFKDNYNIKYMALNIGSKQELSCKNTVGIIGLDSVPYSNVYNSISALTLTDYKTIKLSNISNVTSDFCNDFDVDIQKCKTTDELILGNVVNLYCSFVGINNMLVLYSMDNGVPCIVGNTDLFSDSSILKKYLVLKQDDSIDEIADKINGCIKHKEEIMNEYKKFREKYKNTFIS